MTIPKAPAAQQDEAPRPAASDERSRKSAVTLPERPPPVSPEPDDDEYANMPCTD